MVEIPIVSERNNNIENIESSKVAGKFYALIAKDKNLSTPIEFKNMSDGAKRILKILLMEVFKMPEFKLSKEAGTKKFELSMAIDYDEDGNKEPESDVIIDEIKTMQTDVSLLKEPVYVHKAQALVYGYIYASQKKLPKIGIQMTYVTPEPETINKFLEEYTFERIEEWFNKLITGFKRWTDYTFDERHKRTESVSYTHLTLPTIA